MVRIIKNKTLTFRLKKINILNSILSSYAVIPPNSTGNNIVSPILVKIVLAYKICKRISSRKLKNYTN
jgi:hypothetical protein